MLLCKVEHCAPREGIARQGFIQGSGQTPQPSNGPEVERNGELLRKLVGAAVFRVLYFERDYQHETLLCRSPHMFPSSTYRVSLDLADALHVLSLENLVCISKTFNHGLGLASSQVRLCLERVKIRQAPETLSRPASFHSSLALGYALSATAPTRVRVSRRFLTSQLFLRAFRVPCGDTEVIYYL